MYNNYAVNGPMYRDEPMIFQWETDLPSDKNQVQSRMFSLRLAQACLQRGLIRIPGLLTEHCNILAIQKVSSHILLTSICLELYQPKESIGNTLADRMLVTCVCVTNEDTVRVHVLDITERGILMDLFSMFTKNYLVSDHFLFHIYVKWKSSQRVCLHVKEEVVVKDLGDEPKDVPIEFVNVLAVFDTVGTSVKRLR